MSGVRGFSSIFMPRTTALPLMKGASHKRNEAPAVRRFSFSGASFSYRKRLAAKERNTAATRILWTVTSLSAAIFICSAAMNRPYNPCHELSSYDSWRH